MVNHPTADTADQLVQLINPVHTRDAASLHEQFQSASPFRHVVMESFLSEPLLRGVLEEFPTPHEKDMVSEFGDRSLKHTVESIWELGPSFLQWHTLLQSSDFIHFLETITGIPKLRFDPAYWGAGTHNNLQGQSLDAHVDFNYHPGTGFHRRLNLIVYLCPEWDQAWGGSIEFHRDAWDRSADREVVRYAPLANRAVLFETGEHTWHGFPQINLPPDKQALSRKSLTVYYYTEARENGDRPKAHSTIYVPDWIPDSIQQGEVVTPQTYAELETHLYRRDHYLKRLYEEHHKLYQRYHELSRAHHKMRKVMGFLKPLVRLADKLGLRGLLKRLLVRP